MIFVMVMIKLMIMIATVIMVTLLDDDFSSCSVKSKLPLQRIISFLTDMCIYSDTDLALSLTGHYMYMEMSGRRRNQKARLVSIKFHALKGGACQMRLFYHMFGRHTKDLNVYIQRDGSDKYTTVFSATGNIGDRWNKALVDLSKEYKPFRVVIEGNWIFLYPISVHMLPSHSLHCPVQT